MKIEIYVVLLNSSFAPIVCCIPTMRIVGMTYLSYAMWSLSLFLLAFFFAIVYLPEVVHIHFIIYIL